MTYYTENWKGEKIRKASGWPLLNKRLFRNNAMVLCFYLYLNIYVGRYIIPLKPTINAFILIKMAIQPVRDAVLRYELSMSQTYMPTKINSIYLPIMNQ